MTRIGHPRETSRIATAIAALHRTHAGTTTSPDILQISVLGEIGRREQVVQAVDVGNVLGHRVVRIDMSPGGDGRAPSDHSAMRMSVEAAIGRASRSDEHCPPPILVVVDATDYVYHDQAFQEMLDVIAVEAERTHARRIEISMLILTRAPHAICRRLAETLKRHDWIGFFRI